MKVIFAPVAWVGSLRNRAKISAAAGVFALPLGYALALQPPGWNAASIGLAVLIALACYVFAALFCLRDRSWEGIQEIAGLLQERDLRATALTPLALAEDRTGRMGRLLHGLRNAHERIGHALAEVHRTAAVCRETAERLAGGSSDLAERTEEQASTLEETASAMEQLAATVKQNAESCRRASELAEAATGIARDGARGAGDLVATMELVDLSSRRIVDIIGVIEGISFQTNILALNAAVEAARAGEHGRGFAVVAEEVRALARRSAEAAREIKVLIQESAANVSDGSRLVNASGRTIAELAASVEKVNALVGEIADASAEQSRGVQGIDNALEQLQRATQKNAALVHESAQSADAIRGQAVRLSQLVGQFRIEEHAALTGEVT